MLPEDTGLEAFQKTKTSKTIIRLAKKRELKPREEGWLRDIRSLIRDASKSRHRVELVLRREHEHKHIVQLEEPGLQAILRTVEAGLSKIPKTEPVLELDFEDEHREIEERKAQILELKDTQAKLDRAIHGVARKADDQDRALGRLVERYRSDILIADRQILRELPRVAKFHIAEETRTSLKQQEELMLRSIND